MPSLMECVLEHAHPDQDDDEFLDSLSIDRFAVSSIEGGWEKVDVDDLDPQVDGVSARDFRQHGPSVYEIPSGYLIVRGYDGRKFHWFVFEPVGVGSHN